MFNSLRWIATLCISLIVVVLVFGMTAAQEAEISKIAFVSDRDGDLEIYIMNADGTDLRRLTEEPGNDLGPVFSPDGSQIAFSSDRGDITSIYLMDVNGENIMELTKDGGIFPDWSPDGKYIAYDHLFKIHIVEVDTLKDTQLTTDGSSYPRWSPDGKYIAYSSFLNDAKLYDLYVMDADGQNQRKLTNAEGDHFASGWSPDSQSIIFDSNRDGDFKSYMIDIEDGSIEQLTTADGVDLLGPVWSPDGKYILFVSDADLYVVNADGTEAINITNTSAGEFMADWSAGEVPEPVAPIMPTDQPAPTDAPDSDSTTGSTGTGNLKPGDWEGDEVATGFAGDVSFEVTSDGQIRNFRIKVPVFGDALNRGCETTVRNPSIEIQADGSFVYSFTDGSTQLDLAGQFESDTTLTISQALGVCQGNLLLFGITYDVKWVRD